MLIFVDEAIKQGDDGAFEEATIFSTFATADREPMKRRPAPIALKW